MTPPADDETGLGLLLSTQLWKRRLALWGGAVLVALAAILFARAADLAFSLFRKVLQRSPGWTLILTPATFAVVAWCTRHGLEATRGSGIPQVIAGLEMPPALRQKHLSLKVAVAKLVLTVIGMLGGASIGREGPTVHVGAGLMQAFGRWLGFSSEQQVQRFLLAGGAAGLAAAFNTPLAGVVFAIEELSGTYEHRFSGTLLTAVIVGGVVSLALLGNYTYFGTVHAQLSLSSAWLAVPLCGILCGLAGGLFSRLILVVTADSPPWLARLRQTHPVMLATVCGVLLAGLGLGFGDGAFGTGYEQARGLVQGQALVGHEFGVVKFIANLVSYAAAIPGGLFSPALAVGAGFGYNLSALLPHVPVPSLVLLGMCGYLAGVTQAPLTSAVIAMEMTDNQDMLLPILTTVLLARTASALICRQPLYKALAQRLLTAPPQRDGRP
ncbi:MAG: chloride channel protein [Thermomonas hydrothermalis]|uniref:chloride channel protein n=1 Tax=Thermomonas hydrothermalis TaxID=213588 RepID=UPI002357F136|nr:chloride channel protein [Thermomonas hydrothermalis]MCL6619384.1 chloride channel protein [Thermomonas hydrothermalis]